MKYIITGYLGCCLLLMTLSYMDIQHVKRMEDIWEEYNKEIGKIHTHPANLIEEIKKL